MYKIIVVIAIVYLNMANKYMNMRNFYSKILRHYKYTKLYSIDMPVTPSIVLHY